MPLRPTRPRKNDGLKKYIAMLYEKPVLKFLKASEPWEPIADLIFGPPTDRPTREEIEKLKPIWHELREDIIAAHSSYQPNKKPWGCRFDRRSKS